MRCDDLEGGIEGERLEGGPGGRDICIHVADSLHGTAENSVKQLYPN